MLNLLVVDDEPLITDLIYGLCCDLEDLDMEVYKAFSGPEALEKLGKIRVDIVLLDICMPGMSGLEVQNEIVRNWPECKVIFLTGFDDFDFIQAAVRNRSFDYILKTEDEKTIEKVLRNAIREVEKQIDIQKTLAKARHDIRLALASLREKYLLDLINGSQEEIHSIQIHFHELEMPLDFHNPVLLLLARLEMPLENGNSTSRMKTLYEIKTIAGEFLPPHVIKFPIIYDRSRIFWIMQPDFSNAGKTNPVMEWKRLVMSIQRNLDSIQTACKEALNISVSFILNNAPVHWGMLSETFDRLDMTLSREAGVSRETLLLSGETLVSSKDGQIQDKEKERNSSARLLTRRIAILRELLEKGNEEEFFTHFSDFSRRMKDLMPLEDDFILEVYFSLSAVFLSHINKWKLAELTNTRRILNLLDDIDISDAGEAWRKMSDFFKGLGNQLFGLRKDESFRDTNRIFGFIKKYTEDNLKGDLSLSRFAELLHYHPFYLSRLFKQVTGKSLSEYVSEVKLKKAREMLEQEERRINEIAASLGFDTASYFTRFFKKYTRQTPQEYRNQFRNDRLRL